MRGLLVLPADVLPDLDHDIVVRGVVSQIPVPLHLIDQRRQRVVPVAEARRAGRPFRQLVNETLRRGLASRRITAQRQAFKVTARDLGDLKPGLSLDNVAELI